MPRPTRSTKTETRSVTLPKALWAFIDKTDWDTLREKPRYGHLVRFFERLIRQEQNRVASLQNLVPKEPTAQEKLNG